jgi:hypothetical protein
MTSRRRSKDRQGRVGAVVQQLSYACSFRRERRQSAGPGRTPVTLRSGLRNTDSKNDLVPTPVAASVPPIFILFYGPQGHRPYAVERNGTQRVE